MGAHPGQPAGHQFPLHAVSGAGTFVRSLALYPLTLLLVVLLLRWLRGEIRLPRLGSFTVLTAFVLAAIASTALGATFAPIELRGVDYADRAIPRFRDPVHRAGVLPRRRLDEPGRRTGRASPSAG